MHVDARTHARTHARTRAHAHTYSARHTSNAHCGARTCVLTLPICANLTRVRRFYRFSCPCRWWVRFSVYAENLSSLFRLWNNQLFHSSSCTWWMSDLEQQFRVNSKLCFKASLRLLISSWHKSISEPKQHEWQTAAGLWTYWSGKLVTLSVSVLNEIPFSFLVWFRFYQLL